MNRTYFEPKQLNNDELNLLKQHHHEQSTDDNGDDDETIELGIKLNQDMDSHEHHPHHVHSQSDTVLLDIDTTNGCHEWFKATAWRIQQSVQFFVVYLVLIILNAFVLIWELTDGADRKMCIIIEGVITLMFCGEVAVQILTEEWGPYWSAWLNRLDFVVCALCVVLYVVFASYKDAPHSHYSIGNYMDAILVGIRYCMQFVRLVRFAQRGHENRKMLHQTEVKFNDHATLSVLHLHGVEMAKQNSKKQKKQKQGTIQHKLHAFLSGNQFYNVLVRANENELKSLKDSIDSVEFVDDDGCSSSDVEVEDAEHAFDDDDDGNEERRRQYVAEVLYGVDGHEHEHIMNVNGQEEQQHKPLFKPIRNQHDDGESEPNNLSAPITPHTPDVHIASEHESDKQHHGDHLSELGLMYDSEQMAAYHDIVGTNECSLDEM